MSYDPREQGIYWEYDAPTGTYRSPTLSAALWRESAKPGLACQYAPVEVRGRIGRSGVLEQLGHLDPNHPTQEVLVRQARLLSQMFPLTVPHLRLGLSTNYGRDTSVAWYDPIFEKVLLRELHTPPTINPLEVV